MSSYRFFFFFFETQLQLITYNIFSSTWTGFEVPLVIWQQVSLSMGR